MTDDTSTDPTGLIPLFTVKKFFPPRCPGCYRDFTQSPDDFVPFAGNQGSSYQEALYRQRERFPEIYGQGFVSFEIPETRPFEVSASLFNLETGEVESTRRLGANLGIDFIMCRACRNVTMRIEYASQQVMTEGEAQRLVSEEGFTTWSAGQAFGNMAQPMQTLSTLARADIEEIQAAVSRARKKTAAIDDEYQRGDAFAADTSLLSILAEMRNRTTLAQARNGLERHLGNTWQLLDTDVRDFLITAEVLKEQLAAYGRRDESIDYAPVVVAYSKAVEREVFAKFFDPFLSSEHRDSSRVESTGDRQIDRSLEALDDFTAGRRPLTLGDMAFCIKNVGCSDRISTGFRRHMIATLGDANAFCDMIPSRLLEYLTEFRNRSAHIERVTLEECVAAHNYLLEEPVRLILRIEEAIAR